jgi:hypothetical protein
MSASARPKTTSDNDIFIIKARVLKANQITKIRISPPIINMLYSLVKHNIFTGKKTGMGQGWN